MNKINHLTNILAVCSNKLRFKTKLARKRRTNYGQCS